MYLFGNISHCRSAAFVALLYGIMPTGCGKPQPAPDSAERQVDVPERVCPFPEDELAVRLVQWAVGCEAMRQSEPRSSAAVTILDGKSRRPGICVQASSLLPSPDGKQVFVAGGSTFHVIDMPGGKPVSLALAATRGWDFTRLLAFERGSRPLAILAEMKRAPRDEYALWRIEVRGRQATARQLTLAEQPADARAFFARYQVPRCEHDDKRCIVTVDKGSNAGKARIEIRRGALSEKQIEIPAGTRGIIDATWMPGSADAMALLVDHPDC